MFTATPCRSDRGGALPTRARRWHTAAQRKAMTRVVSGLLILGLSACSTVRDRNTALGLAVVGAAHAPTTAIHQVYYLGVFDPRDQVPPTIYRVRVRGQASALNFTRFASGWVRAELVDSLTARIGQDGDGNGSGRPAATVEPLERGALGGRRLVMFGPEGFREAPRDHRLVVVMGSSPEKFFSAVDQALGVVAQATQGTGSGPEIERALWQDLAASRDMRQGMRLVLDAAGL
ncbi:hypothetical protein [Aquabacterium sp. OR-4]|uniref:hypothetical protein n=1 Tax=Aquabacterium sp. OR-4 TaxID=2978127 RepID=UPI0028C6671A|nr:hypothetical protein [Aquabacterium sp. OR-4]MDT7835737.1 hypothetical protein [Aquabacterium sp. OR-4]